jgi:hypothetical protein
VHGPLVGSGDDGDGTSAAASPPRTTAPGVATNTVSHTAGSGIQALLLSKALVAGSVIGTTGQRGILLG